MNRILVVDDSAAARTLAGTILSKSPSLDVVYAEDGAQALEAVEAQPPTLVLTDLLMPGVDGLELVRELKRRHPGIPAILMTAEGSEEVAVEALRVGAINYVPKRSLAHTLLETVESALKFSSQQVDRARLVGLLSRNELCFELESEPSLVSPLVSYLRDAVRSMGLCEEGGLTRVSIALEEAVANAIYHGNLQVDAELRSISAARYHRTARERAAMEPYRNRRVHVEANLTRQEAVWTIRDEGAGFDPATIHDPTDPANLNRPGGRGVFLMHTFMDEVTYNEKGNEVTLLKRRSAADLEAHA